MHLQSHCTPNDAMEGGGVVTRDYEEGDAMQYACLRPGMQARLAFQK